MARHHRALVLSFAAGLLAGCDDREITPVAPPARFAQQAAEYVNDRTVADRFTLDVDVTGSLRPGQPIHLTLRGTANFRTGDAELRLTLPEVSAAEQSSWEVVELPIGEESLPRIRVRRAFSAGEEFRERTSLTIPEPGYYYVVATAKQHSDDRLSDRPNQVTDVSTHAMWLWIDEHGGRVTAEFDSTLFSGDVRKERGPRAPSYKLPRIRRKGDAYIACAVSPWPAPEITIQACPTGGTVTAPSEGGAATHALRVTYDNTDAGHSYTPVANAQVEWRVTTAGGGFVSSGSSMTDASGGIPVVQCQGTTSDRNVSVSVYTRNERVSVTYSRGALAGTYTAPCGGTGEVRLDPLMAHLFINLVKTAEGHQIQFGSLPPRIYAGMYDDGRTYYDYDHPDGELHIYHSGTMVWGGYGVLVAAHEYGHYFQDRTLYQPGAANGLMRFYNVACRDPHAPESASNFGCAWGEGFADWYAVVVRGSETGSWLRSLEENFYYKNCIPSGGTGRGLVICTDDGSIVEGAIASLLLDLTDGIGAEAHDGLQVSPATVAAAIKSCWVHPASRTTSDRIPYNGIDHLLYCWENRKPYEVDLLGYGLRTFFNTRLKRDWPDHVLGAAIMNGDDRFRRLWLVNLYSKRPEVGTVPIFREQIPGDPLIIETEPPVEPEPCYSNGFQLICPTV